MESTSDYWRVWYYVLEAHGLAVTLVSSSHARQLAGRPKTDRLDAQWLARLAEMGLLRPSFVPPAEIRELRDSPGPAPPGPRPDRAWQRLEKLLEGALMQAVVGAVVAGEGQDRRAVIREALAGASATRGPWPPWPRAAAGRAGRPRAGPGRA